MIDEERFKGVQRDILFAEKKNQLVSAGAGSGKTTVMIEKIADLLIEKDVDIDSLLVVTFTVLAAQEMKERLVKKLKLEMSSQTGEKKEKLLSLVEKVKTASIDTIDGFSSKTIKKYFYELEISPNIEILSDATKDYYLTKAMNKTLLDFSKNKYEINLMLDLFGGNARNLNNLKELILSSYYNIINIENYEQFLNDTYGEYLDPIKSENVLNNHICSLSENAIKFAIEESVNFSNNVKNKIATYIDDLKNFSKYVSLKTNLKVLYKLETVKFTPTEFKENEGLKNVSLKLNEIIKLKNNFEKNEINENFDEKNAKICEYLLIFINLLKNFIKNYNEIKTKNNLIDFNDLNRLMLKLLENENIKKELQEKYKYIFIDEYQDVNPLQDQLMTGLVGVNTTVFMVGDVKQSIYGFRGSSPEWFLEKYNKMKERGADEDVFDMNINFRSSPTVLKFINELFSTLMTKQIADIDYKTDAMIEPMRDDIVDEKVKILLVTQEDEEEIANGVYSVQNHKGLRTSPKNKEAELVAKEITELVGKPFYDANEKRLRELKYSDIAILTHSDKDQQSCELVNVLRENAIPVNRNNKLDVDKSEIIKLILSILKCVNQTADDVDYLAAFMALTEMDIDDVVEIRDKTYSFYENLLSNKENIKIKYGFELLNDLTNASYVKSNKELIFHILDVHKLRYNILRKPNGEKELNLLEEFLQKLSPLEDSLGLSEFIDMVESNVDGASDFVSIDKEDSVTLQTIHKSKGLEYPVVILFNSSKMFAYLRENDAINFNAQLGFGLDFFDTINRIKMDSLTKMAIKLENNKKGYKEELRLLYVALTRAKNKLIITGSYKPKASDDELKKTSYTNMILSCFEDQIGDDGLEKQNFVLKFIDDFEMPKKKQGSLNDEVELYGIDFDYKNKNKFNIPIKNSVTGINGEMTAENEFVLRNILSEKVQYDSENKVEIGVEYHKALELLNFEKPYQQNSNLENVDYNKIKMAHEKIGALIKDVKSIKKEAEFMMYVPYNEVVESDIEDKVLIQGVVDLIIEHENSIDIVDYKFSKLPSKILKQKYEKQLQLYKKAVENAFKKPVEHMFIYSINSGELV